MTDNTSYLSQAIEDALSHVRRVCEWCELQQPDARILAILNSLQVKTIAVVITRWGVKVRSGDSLLFPQVGSLPYQAAVELISRTPLWGKIADKRWITLDPRFVSLAYQ